MLVEYIKESELGKNYRKNYIVEVDEQTKQAYIVDYTQKYKYIILPDDMDAVEANRPTELDKLRYNYGYVDENELKLIDLANVKISKDDTKNEYFIQDINNLYRRWIILPNNWNDDANTSAPYINEDDVDLLKWVVYLDSNSNRKYIVDERTGTSYFLVQSNYMMEFRKYWTKCYKSEQHKLKSVNGPNETRTPMPTDVAVIEYVDEDELANMDLLNVKVQKDEYYNEYFIQNPLDANHRWVVLSRNWRVKSTEHYISEDDYNPKDYIIYLDVKKRRYIRDDKTNRCFFIVPSIKDQKQTFKQKWTQINETLKKATMQTKSPRMDEKDKIRIIQPASEIRQLQQSPKITPKSLPKPPQQSDIDNFKRVRSPSNDLLERGNYSSVGHSSGRNYQNQMFKSTDNLSETRSPILKKSVYFNENVKVSDGTHEYNHKIQKNDDKTMDVKLSTVLLPQQQQQQHTPPVKPRIIKPMGASLHHTENTVPIAITSTQSNNNSHANEKMILIKQKGRPGHLIKPNNSEHVLNC